MKYVIAVLETNNCAKNDIVYSIQCQFINVNFVSFLLFFVFFHQVVALLFIFTIFLFILSLGVQNPKLTNPKPGDRLHLCPTLPSGYAIFNSFDFRSFIIDGCKLRSVTEIASEPIKIYSSDAAMIQFGKKDSMIDSVKGYLQVYEDTSSKVAIVKSITYYFCEAYNSMIS